MAAEGDHIMANKNNLIVKSGITTQTGPIGDSSQGLHNSKSMSKVDLHICMM